MKPTIVPETMSADTANKLYGERYGVDWQYAPPSVKVEVNGRFVEDPVTGVLKAGLKITKPAIDDDSRAHEAPPANTTGTFRANPILSELTFVEVASDHALTHKPVDLPPQSWIGDADEESRARVLPAHTDRLCINCDHMCESEGYHYCEAIPCNIDGLVTGAPMLCSIARKKQQACGPSAQLFEHRRPREEGVQIGAWPICDLDKNHPSSLKAAAAIWLAILALAIILVLTFATGAHA